MWYFKNVPLDEIFIQNVHEKIYSCLRFKRFHLSNISWKSHYEVAVQVRILQHFHFVLFQVDNGAGEDLLLYLHGCVEIRFTLRQSDLVRFTLSAGAERLNSPLPMMGS